jgi:hypothetical protein
LITQEEYLMFHWDTKSYIEVTVQYISYYSINYIPLHSSMSLKKQVIIPQLPLQFSFWAPPLTVPTEVVGIVSPHLESTQFWWGHLLPHGASLFHTDSMLSQAQNIKHKEICLITMRHCQGIFHHSLLKEPVMGLGTAQLGLCRPFWIGTCVGFVLIFKSLTNSGKLPTKTDPGIRRPRGWKASGFPSTQT